MWATSSTTKSDQNTRRGFTIVELLIVIVVIGILAAIVIVAYNGIQTRARVAAVSSALEQTSKKLALYAVDNSAFPPDLATVGINNISGTTYQYSVNNAVSPQTYCVTATNVTTSYFVSSTNNVPTAGACPGQGVNGVAPITNLATNPSFEGGIWGKVYSSAPTVLSNGSPGTVPYGSTALKVVPAANTAYTGWSTGDPPGWASGQTYTVSVSIYRTSVSETLGYFVDGVSETIVSVPVNTWTRIAMTFTYTSGSFGIRQDNSTASPSPFYLDGVMYTHGSTQYSYADGSSPNWVWNGTPNASTSTGAPQ